MPAIILQSTQTVSSHLRRTSETICSPFLRFCLFHFNPTGLLTRKYHSNRFHHSTLLSNRSRPRHHRGMPADAPISHRQSVHRQHRQQRPQRPQPRFSHPVATLDAAFVLERPLGRWSVCGSGWQCATVGVGGLASADDARSRDRSWSYGKLCHGGRGDGEVAGR